jgi:hypothetical protein
LLISHALFSQIDYTITLEKSYVTKILAGESLGDWEKSTPLAPPTDEPRRGTHEDPRQRHSRNVHGAEGRNFH